MFWRVLISLKGEFRFSDQYGDVPFPSAQEALREVERSAARTKLAERPVDMTYLKNTLLQLYTKGARPPLPRPYP